jgi:hypothetical protein
VAPQHTNGDEAARTEERKRLTRVPADAANGLPRYAIRRLDRAEPRPRRKARTTDSKGA